MKWGVHKELDSNFNLQAYMYLPENSFTDNGKDFSVRCVFQIWTRENISNNGYKDYTKIFTKEDYNIIKEQMKNNIQFFFIEPLCETAEKFVLSGDFTGLAARNTSTPGFGKADFVSYYLQWINEST